MDPNQPPFFQNPQPNPATQPGAAINDQVGGMDVQRMFVEFMAQFDQPGGSWAKAAEEYRRRDQAISQGGPR